MSASVVNQDEGLPAFQQQMIRIAREKLQSAWVQSKDMSYVAEQMYELKNTAIPESPQLTDLLETDAYGGIQELIDIWNDPNRTQADKDAAVASFEQMMGQEPGWFADQMASMYGQLEGGVQGQQGLTPEYTEAFNRETQLELQNMRNEYTQMLEAMSAQGRNVAAYTKMDEVVNSMASYEAQRRMERENLNMATQQAEYDALENRYNKLRGVTEINQTSARW